MINLQPQSTASRNEKTDEPDEEHVTVLAKAVKAVEEGRVSLLPKEGCFVVRGNYENPQFVFLNPKESCSCPGTAICWHILAVRRSIGRQDVSTKRMPNISTLRTQSWKNSMRPKGKKQPTRGDRDPSPSFYTPQKSSQTCYSNKVYTTFYITVVNLYF